MSIHTDPGVRHEAVLAFDATDSNPRVDDETGHGLHNIWEAQ